MIIYRRTHGHRNDGPGVRNGNDESDRQTREHHQPVGVQHAGRAAVRFGGIRATRQPQRFPETAPAVFGLRTGDRFEFERHVDAKGSRVFFISGRQRNGILGVQKGVLNIFSNLLIIYYDIPVICTLILVKRRLFWSLTTIKVSTNILYIDK